MYLTKVSISGFKSYASPITLTDLQTFNCIIGLNGTGKSNILDAIIFCLNLDNLSVLRVRKLEDLINKSSSEAKVTLEFTRNDPKSFNTPNNLSKNTIWPVGYDTYNTITIMRSISRDGKSKSTLNNSPCTSLTLKKIFSSVNLSKNQTNIVVQGKITTLLSKCFKEIVEETAGIKVFEQEKEKALALIESKEEKFNGVKNILNMTVEPFVVKLRESRCAYYEMMRLENNLRYNNETVEQIEKTLRFNDLLSLFTIVKNEIKSFIGVENEKINVSEALKDLGGIDEKIYDISKSIEENEVKLGSIYGKIKVTDEKYVNLAKEYFYIKNEIKNLLENGNFNAEESKKHDKNKLKDKKIPNINDIDFTKDTKLTELVNEEIKKENEKVLVLHEKDNFIADEIRTQEKASSGIQNQNVFLVNKLEDLEKMKIDRQDMSEKIKNLSSKISRVIETQNECEVKNLYKSMIDSAENKSFDALLNLCQKKIEEHKKMIISKDEIDQLSYKYNNLKRRLGYPLLKGVYGLVHENYTLKDKKYELAINTVMGPRMSYIIVDNEKVGSHLINEVSNNKSNKRVNVIPLSKIKFNNSFSKKEKRIKEKGGIRGIELIEFSSELKNAFEYICGNIFVFEKKEDARECCFNLNVMCVSLCGNVYDPRGIITGGKEKEFKNGFGNQIKIKDVYDLKNKLEEMEKNYGMREKHVWNVKRYSEIRNLAKEVNECEKNEKVLDEKITFVESYLKNKDLNSNNEEVLKKIRNEIREREIRRDKLRKNRDEILNRKNEIEISKEEFEQLNNEKEKLEKKLERDRKEMESIELQKGKKEVIEKEKKELDTKNDLLIKKAEKIKVSLKKVVEKIKDRVEKGKVKNIIKDLKKWNPEEIFEYLVKETEKNENDENKNITQFDDKKEINYLKKNQYIENQDDSDYENHKKLCSFEISEIPPQLKPILEGIDSSLLSMKNIKTLSSSQIETLNKKIQKSKLEIQSLKKLNQSKSSMMDPKNFSLLEKNEEKIKILESKIKKLEQDKLKLKDSLSQMSIKGSEQFNKALLHLKKYIPKFLSYFIKDSDIRIDPKTYELSIKIMGSWKNSMKELSGGQRSIVALSIIFAMLKFNPAPFYLFDEIDSALDLSFTQGIGEVIKNEFNKDNSRAQFVVVSLKDGMYNNADAIYRVCQEDGKNDVKKVK